MAEKSSEIQVNRAPVLTLWAAVVAERLGHDRQAALSLGKAVAGLNAQAKGRRLGIFSPSVDEEGKPRKKHGLGEEMWVELCGRSVPAKKTAHGVRAVVRDRPVAPGPVETYLKKAFGERLEEVRRAMKSLAAAFDKDELASQAFHLYEQFRPPVASGTRGWGQKGALDLARIARLKP